MRSVVSYGDLGQVTTMSTPGPPKKRKRQQNKRKSSGSQKFTHWDEPVENHDVSLLSHDSANGDEVVDAESRELTHEEIWDDSALVEAWDAAMDEYRAFHGENKWKTEPASKPSPLWYNVPPSVSGTGADSGSKLLSPTHENYTAAEPDSVPLNFDTFVPSHNPPVPNLIASNTWNIASLSQDEAFQNALNAMYWTGYWTAVYHCRGMEDQTMSEEMDNAEYGGDEPGVGGAMGEFVTSQR